jgi:transcriptional regulator with XRE-family HTH domain
MRQPNDISMNRQQEADGFWAWHVRSLQLQADRLIARHLKTTDSRAKQAAESVTGPILDWFARSEKIDEQSWMKIARTAMLLSGNEMAERLGITRMSYYKLEARERRGNISVATLKRVAAAMDCEIVYFVRPTRGTFSEVIWRSLAEEGKARPQVKNAEVRAKDRVLATVVNEVMKTPAVRRKKKWTERVGAKLRKDE